MIETGISRLGKNKAFKESLRFDVTPQVLFKPRFINAENQAHLVKETQGFSFYVEYMEGLPLPALMVMKTYCLRSKTIAHITDAPEDLLWAAVRDKNARDIAGMYPLSPAIEEWIKSHLNP